MVKYFSMTQEELKKTFKLLGIPTFRADQLWNWTYTHGVIDLSKMSNFSASLQEALSNLLDFQKPVSTSEQVSLDGTKKWVLQFFDQKESETVFIPAFNRGTVCVSSQIGCTLSCTFCYTGTQMWVRNLNADEIVGQVCFVKDHFNDWGQLKKHVTNIVFMGMGEPLYNFDNVAQSIKILTEGLGFSKQKITISTSGVVPGINRCGKEIGVRLAVSLHAVTNDVRDRLVPLNKKYPIQEVIAACKRYPKVHDFRRITFEYVMLKGINDSDQEARELVRLIQGIPAKINLIPFNPWESAPYEASSLDRIQKFAAIILKAGIPAPIRISKGQDILAACGQLKSKSERERKFCPKDPIRN